MNGTSRHGQFLSLIESFLGWNREVDTFCAEFMTLWMQDRDKTYAKKATWSQPYDELLLTSWQRGEISEDEFQKEWAKLWGYAEEVEFRDMIDEIHSACSVFSPAPELQWEMDEEQLRQAVKESFGNYDRLRKPAAQTV